MAWVNALAALLGGSSLAALIGYLLSRRQHSGKIDTSDAGQLWKESQDMRRELRQEVERLRQKVDDLESKVDRLEARLRHYEDGAAK